MTVNNIQNGINDIIISNSIINASYIINLNNSFFWEIWIPYSLKCSNFKKISFKNRNTNNCHDTDFVARKKERIFQGLR